MKRYECCTARGFGNPKLNGSLHCDWSVNFVMAMPDSRDSSQRNHGYLYRAPIGYHRFGSHQLVRPYKFQLTPVIRYVPVILQPLFSKIFQQIALSRLQGNVFLLSKGLDVFSRNSTKNVPHWTHEDQFRRDIFCYIYSIFIYCKDPWYVLVMTKSILSRTLDIIHQKCIH